MDGKPSLYFRPSYSVSIDKDERGIISLRIVVLLFVSYVVLRTVMGARDSARVIESRPCATDDRLSEYVCEQHLEQIVERAQA
jgi:hypothetical protein